MKFVDPAKSQQIDGFTKNPDARGAIPTGWNARVGAPQIMKLPRNPAGGFSTKLFHFGG
jgi:hypothetical protein